MFYACLFYFSTRNWSLLGREINLSELNIPKAFFFLKYFPVEFVDWLICLTPIVALITLYLPQKRCLRIVTAFLLLLTFAYKNSFGKPLHGELPWLYSAIVFGFIPTWCKASATTWSRSRRFLFLQTYWFGLFVFLFPYTLSGLWKVTWGMMWQPIFDPISFWSPDSMSYLLSTYSVRINEAAVWTDWLIRNPVIGYPLLLGGTYWEVIAILPLFRPKHWRLTAFVVLMFHLLSYYTLNIQFGYQFFIASFFLFFVPLYDEPKNIYQLIEELPIIGFITKKKKV